MALESKFQTSLSSATTHGVECRASANRMHPSWSKMCLPRSRARPTHLKDRSSTIAFDRGWQLSRAAESCRPMLPGSSTYRLLASIKPSHACLGSSRCNPSSVMVTITRKIRCVRYEVHGFDVSIHPLTPNLRFTHNFLASLVLVLNEMVLVLVLEKARTRRAQVRKHRNSSNNDWNCG
jgi:hypothetical protein